MGAAVRLPRRSRVRLRGTVEMAADQGEAGRGPSVGFPRGAGVYTRGGGGNEGLRVRFGCGFVCGKRYRSAAAAMPRVLQSCNGEVRTMQGCQILVGAREFFPLFPPLNFKYFLKCCAFWG